MKSYTKGMLDRRHDLLNRFCLHPDPPPKSQLSIEDLEAGIDVDVCCIKGIRKDLNFWKDFIF